MPVTPTFPGIYIEELPSSTHTITPAPTSVTVFIGYTHPLKTDPTLWNKPTEIFSFSDYERRFGGFLSSGAFEGQQFGDIAHAVNQFFENGGSNAWIVGLSAGATPASLQIGSVLFTAAEITDGDHGLTLAITANALLASPPAAPTYDITITYGPPSSAASPTGATRAEVYRNVNFGPPSPVPSNAAQNKDPDFVVNKINATSSLVRLSVGTPAGGTPPPLSLPSAGDKATPVSFGPTSFPATIFDAGAIFNTFDADGLLDKVDIFNLLVIPGVFHPGVISAAQAFCERKRAFLIMDPPPDDSADGTAGPDISDDMTNGTNHDIPKSKNAALYFPYLNSSNPLTGDLQVVPPGGTVAGVFARTDRDRGVWKAPAGLETILSNVTDVADGGKMTDNRQGVLNNAGVNAIRNFPNVGPVVFGARTTVSANVSFQEWKYVPVRRMALFLEQTLYAALKWVVFEPNDEPLWAAIRTSINAFMLGLFRQGAFQGAKPSDAFQVKCDHDTTTQADIDNGIVNVVVAFAPLKPAEFVVIQIAQLAGQTQAS